MEPIKVYYIILKKTPSESGNEYQIESYDSKYILINEIYKEAKELGIDESNPNEIIQQLIKIWNTNQMRNSYQLTMHSLQEISDNDLMEFLENNNY